MKCPDCGREKALNAEQVAKGDCPKWWAIRDQMAETDCDNYANLTGPYDPQPHNTKQPEE